MDNSVGAFKRKSFCQFRDTVYLSAFTYCRASPNQSCCSTPDFGSRLESHSHGIGISKYITPHTRLLLYIYTMNQPSCRRHDTTFSNSNTRSKARISQPPTLSSLHRPPAIIFIHPSQAKAKKKMPRQYTTLTPLYTRYTQ